MLNKIEQLAERVVEHQGVEMIPIEFDNIVDDSRLVLQPEVKITVNRKFQNNYFECAKAITHEYRHLFQILWVSMMNDERARRWKKAFEELLSSENANIVSSSADATRFVSQEIELDAFAFTKYYLEKYESMKVIHPCIDYERLIKKYIETNLSIL